MRTGGRPPRSHYPASKQVGAQRWIQVLGAARRLRVTKGRIYQLIRARRLKSQHLDGITYVREQDVDVYQIYRQQIRRLQQSTRKKIA